MIYFFELYSTNNFCFIVHLEVGEYINLNHRSVNIILLLSLYSYTGLFNDKIIKNIIVSSFKHY